MLSKARSKSPRQQHSLTVEGPLAERALRAKELVQEWLDTFAEVQEIASRFDEGNLPRHKEAPLKQTIVSYYKYMFLIEKSFRREYIVPGNQEDSGGEGVFFDSFALMVDNEVLSCSIKISAGDLSFHVYKSRSVLLGKSGLSA